jgi:hypothetical protein
MRAVLCMCVLTRPLPALCARGRARPRDSVSHLGIRLRRILRCAAGGASGRDSPWIPIILKGFFRGGKGVGSSLYRVPSPCHAERLIPAVRFLRKGKASSRVRGTFRAAESLHATEHARNTLRRTVCAAYGDEFFLYEKMGRRAIGHAGSISEAGGRAQASVPTPYPQKDGNPRGARAPWQEARRVKACGFDPASALEVFP